MNTPGVVASMVAVLVLSGCMGVAVEDAIVAEDLGPDDLVECRILGGNTVYTEYSDGEGSSSKGVQEGIPKGKRHSAIGETTIETNPRKLRAQQAELRANGWNQRSIQDLVSLGEDYEMAQASGFKGSEAKFDARKRELQARLERMPSCLEEARGKAADR